MSVLCARNHAGERLFAHLAEKPCAAQCPKTVGGAAADAQNFGSGLMRQTSEVTQLDQVGGFGIVSFEQSEGLVECCELIRAVDRNCEVHRKFNPYMAAAMFFGLLAASLIDKNAPHRFGGGGEEMASAVPLLSFFHFH